MPKEGVLKPVMPRRYSRLESFTMPEDLWEAFQIPVGLAFFFWSSVENRIKGFYPSPMAAVEVLLPIEDTWLELERINSVLKELRGDIEALLVNRMRGMTPIYYIVPIDECYKLVAVMKSTWKGITGGREAEAAIMNFFRDLTKRSLQTTEMISESKVEVVEEFVKVAGAHEVHEGNMKMVKVDDRQILLANIEGKYYAIGNVCTHRGATLSDGVLHGNVVTCPWHFSQFDVTTGEIVSPPATRPEPRYEVKAQDSSILIKKTVRTAT
jgi:nitrite reductase/ring-hydroxylating ferredoxin subunit